MASTLQAPGSWDTLSDVIRQVRSRWRLRLLLHGLTIVVGGGLVAFLLGAWIMRLFHFATPAVVAARLLTYATLAALVTRYMVFPLRRRPSDAQVALYLEEHEPSLDAVVVSAVETKGRDLPPFMRSQRLVDRLVEMATARVRTIDNGARIETREMTTSLLALLGMAIVGALILGMGPEFLRTGARLLAAPRARADQRVFIAVQPGDAKVSRHGDQAIRARLQGFGADQAELVMQRGGGTWERLPMTFARDSGAFVIRLFNLSEPTAYYVESNGIRSPTYHLDIVNLPFVKAMALEYHYPAYTGLGTKLEPHGGDIAAPQGTSVIVRATTTMPVQGGRIAIPGHAPIPMTLGPDGVLTGTIPVTDPGFYKVELQAANGSYLPGSLDYTIDVIKDAPPTITFLKPGRDVDAAPADDVFTQVQATDDYGVADVQVRYSVNGGPEQTVSLHSSPARKEVVAGHSFFLKQLALQPGDMVSYYAQATDNDAIHGGKVVKTDLYFVNVRDRKQGDGQKGMQQQGQQGGQAPTVLARKQREIIAGTFKVDRDRTGLSAAERREDLATLGQAQNWLRGRVDQLQQKIVQRGLPEQDQNFQTVADELVKASGEMQGAEGKLTEANERGALGYEQRALQHIQRADAAFRKIKQQQQQQQQQQNGKPQPPDDQLDNPDSTDLANMFDPQKDQLSKQYETRQPPPQQAVDSAVEKLAQKLSELARRQQREEERKQMASQQMSQQQGKQQQQQQGMQQQGQQQQGQQQQGQQQQGQQQQGDQQGNQQQSDDGGMSQRQIAQETQAAAQMLDRLSKEHPDERGVRESARQLHDAVKAMQQAATGADQQEQARKALAALNEARRRLQQNQQNGGQGDARQQLLDQAHDLVEDAQSMQDRVRQAQEQKGMQRGGNQEGQDKDRAQNQDAKNQEGRSQNQGDSAKGQGKNSMQRGTTPGGSTMGGGDMQFAREAQEQQQAAQQLQRAVQKEGGDTKMLGQAIETLGKLGSPSAYGDKSVLQMEHSLVEGLKSWEYGLRKQFGADKAPRPTFGDVNDVPADFKALVSEYYKALAKKQ